MKSKYLLSLGLLLALPIGALEIYPQVSSTIVSMKTVGTEVAQGEVLVKLDDRQAQLELDYLEAILSIKQQDFDDAQTHFTQTQELYDRLVASHRDLELAQLSLNAAKRELAAHRAKIGIAKIELEKYQIQSPIHGVVEATPNLRNTTQSENPKVLMVLQPK